jgi:membrane protein involved in colicin uptake
MSLPKKANGSTDPHRDPTSIGNLAIQKGYATQDQVSVALKKQEERQPLGRILVEQLVLTNAQLEELLMDQEVLRKKLSPVKAAKLIKKKRREKMREVSGLLKDVAFSLNALAKS